MKQKEKKSSSPSMTIIAVVVIIVVILAGGGLYLLLSTDEDGGKKRHVTNVALLKPPVDMKDRPPPPLKDKPPEEVQKKENIDVRAMAAPGEARSEKADGKPAADGPLGLDAQGGAGSDGFGLVGRKGGRDVTTLGTGGGGGGGGGDMSALLRKYGWYNQRVQDDLRKIVRKRLDEGKGIPKGKLEAIVEILMDDRGTITDHKIVKSSGSQTMDEAVRESLRYAKISEPPPSGIPKKMSIRISSQG
jgi:TonB family protein